MEFRVAENKLLYRQKDKLNKVFFIKTGKIDIIGKIDLDTPNENDIHLNSNIHVMGNRNLK